MYLTEEQVSDVENHAEGELCSKEGEEPLRGIHVRFEVELLEVWPEVGKLFLWEVKRKVGEHTCEMK